MVEPVGGGLLSLTTGLEMDPTTFRLMMAVTPTEDMRPQKLFTVSQDWTIPTGVTSVCIVAIGCGGGATAAVHRRTGGGGALSYRNNIAVSEGDVLTISISTSASTVTKDAVELIRANAGTTATAGAPGMGGAAYTGNSEISFAGGNGVLVTDSAVTVKGGGAGGYSANGINGRTNNSSVLATGGDGANPFGWSPYGWGNRIGRTGPNTDGPGAVRIIWGAGRSFPGNAGDI